MCKPCWWNEICQAGVSILRYINLFIKNSILHTYKKLKPQIWAFIKKTPFLELLETPGHCLKTLKGRPVKVNTVHCVLSSFSRFFATTPRSMRWWSQKEKFSGKNVLTLWSGDKTLCCCIRQWICILVYPDMLLSLRKPVKQQTSSEYICLRMELKR